MQVYINKDIREYQVKDIGPFTLRQAIFSILAVASIFASRAIQRALFGSYISLLLYLPAVPFLLFGFGSSLSIFGGLPFEKWLKSVFVENFLNPRNRPFCYEMTWDINDILTEDELKIYHQMETEKVKKVKKSKLTEEEKFWLKGYK